MSRQTSPAISPEAPYPPSDAAHSLPNPAVYYDASGQRQQLMTDEMMEDISRLSDAAQSVELPNGQPRGLPMIQPAPSIAPDASTPLTPQQHQTPTGASMPMQQQRYGSDGQPIEGYGDGSNKRKRSKVSRACDECRRKKIRCDASKDDGSVETCGNCKRINATCTFSRVPMKRGPSKGYIKELSERVQQVESQMETQRSLSQMGPPLGLRQSLDGRQSLDSNSPGIFGETFSPTEGSFSKKRNFSALSEGAGGGGPSPFAQPQYNRDRMPSVWGLTSTPQSASHAGPRYSIAIAPDQQFPELPLAPPAEISDTPASFKPFWTEIRDTIPQPRGRTESNTSEDATSQSLAPAYQQYLRQTHPVLPILPSTLESLEREVQECSASSPHDVVDALVFVLHKAYGMPTDTEQLSKTLKSYSELEEYVWAKARDDLKSRSESNNFMFLWVCCLMFVVADSDITRHVQVAGKLGKGLLLRIMVDTAVFIVERLRNDEASTDEIDSHKNLAHRNFNIVAILGRLHALGVGIDDPLPDTDSAWALVADDYDLDMLSDSTVVLASYSNLLSSLRLSNIMAPSTPTTGRAMSKVSHRVMRGQLRAIKRKLPDPLSPAAGTIMKQLDFLFELLIARNQSRMNYTHLPVLSWAIATGNYLVRQTISPPQVVNPVLPHLYALDILTLLEFAAAPDPEASPDEDPAIYVLRLLADLLVSLQQPDPEYSRNLLVTTSGNGLHWISALRGLILTQHPGIMEHVSKSSSRVEDPNRGPGSMPSNLSQKQHPTSMSASGSSEMGTNGVDLNGISAVTTINSDVAMAKDSLSKLANMTSSSVTDPAAGPSSPTINNPVTKVDKAATAITNGTPSSEKQANKTGSVKATKEHSSLPPITTFSDARPHISASNDKDNIDTALTNGRQASMSWQMPDFTLLQKKGWMSLIAELTF